MAVVTKLLLAIPSPIELASPTLTTFPLASCVSKYTSKLLSGTVVVGGLYPVQEISSIITCLDVILTISIIISPETFIPETVNTCSLKSSKGVEVPFETPFINTSTCLFPPPVNPL